MGNPRPVKVRCPACGAEVTVQPRVIGVHLEAGRLHATIDTGSVPHVCPTSKARPPVGFAPPAARPGGHREPSQ